MKQLQTFFEVKTPGRGFVDITTEIARAVGRASIRQGLCAVFCAHTSCGLMIQEDADPDVRADLLGWLDRIAPDGDPAYRHVAEGRDDMAAHIRAALSRSSEAIPVVAGKLALGAWQAVYLVEHRTSPHARRIVVHVTGE